MRDARFDRQMRLREVGEEGQRRIAASRLSVSNSPSAAIEVLYLERAGVSVLEPELSMDAPFKHRHAFRHARTSTFGAGAWRALRQLAAVLEG